jgi:hypothetical protein
MPLIMRRSIDIIPPMVRFERWCDAAVLLSSSHEPRSAQHHSTTVAAATNSHTVRIVATITSTTIEEN